MSKPYEVAQAWYGRHLPSSIESQQFQQFAATSASIAHKIAFAPVRVDQASMCGYTDGEIITLPGLYFLNDTYRELGIEVRDWPAAAITASNGTTIHEALHIAYSECNMIAMVEGNDRAEGLIKSSNGFKQILGYVEDVYIESRGREYFEKISAFLIGKNDIFLSQRDFELLVEHIVQDGATQDETVGLLAFRKNINIDDHPYWSHFGRLPEMMDEAKNEELDRLDRVELAVRIYDEIVNDPEIEQSESFNQPSLPDKGELGRDSESGQPTLIDKESNKILQQIMQKMITEHGEQAEEILAEVAEEVNRELEMLEKSKVEQLESKLENVQPVTYKDISVVNPSSKVTPNKSFVKFGNLLRYQHEERHTLGRPSTSGTRIVKQRLHRIATDHKVLAFHDKKQIQKGEPEIVLLCDASGSTSGTLWEEEVKAAYGCFLSLRKATVPVALYAHTSYGAEDQPIIYGIAAYNMPLGPKSMPTTTTDIDLRISRMRSIRLRENFDGYAIRFVSNLFSTKPGTKMLIVLSDGEPAGGYIYSGGIAREHTVAAINDARKRGIAVISVSLTYGVMSSNNSLYGEDWNVIGFDGKLERSLQQVISKVVIPKQ